MHSGLPGSMISMASWAMAMTIGPNVPPPRTAGVSLQSEREAVEKKGDVAIFPHLYRVPVRIISR